MLIKGQDPAGVCGFQTKRRSLGSIHVRPLNLESDPVVRKLASHPHATVKPTIFTMRLMHIHLF